MVGVGSETQSAPVTRTKVPMTRNVIQMPVMWYEPGSMVVVRVAKSVAENAIAGVQGIDATNRTPHVRMPMMAVTRAESEATGVR